MINFHPPFVFSCLYFSCNDWCELWIIIYFHPEFVFLCFHHRCCSKKIFLGEEVELRGFGVLGFLVFIFVMCLKLGGGREPPNRYCSGMSVYIVNFTIFQLLGLQMWFFFVANPIQFNFIHFISLIMHSLFRFSTKSQVLICRLPSTSAERYQRSSPIWSQTLQTLN